MHIWRSKPSPNRKTPIALTIGNFDGVHLGHQAILARLKQTADKLGLATCVMTFEPHPREFFSPDHAPTRLTSFREKFRQLAQSKVDYLRVYRFNYNFAKISPETFISQILHQELSVRRLLVGDDFRFGARRAGDYSLLASVSKQHGFEVEKMPSVLIDGQRISSSLIRKALKIGDLKTAQRFLGRSFSIGGRVVDGDKLGKKLGFPTANIQIGYTDPPISGIFVVNVYGAIRSDPSVALPGVASLGVRPTVHQNGQPILEVHLFDFDCQIYGRYLQVDFLHKLRDEERLPDLEALTHKIKEDIVQAKHYFNRVNDCPASNDAI